MSGLEQQFLVTLDRQAEIGIRAATISDMRQRLTQGHQLVSPLGSTRRNSVLPGEASAF